MEELKTKIKILILLTFTLACSSQKDVGKVVATDYSDTPISQSKQNDVDNSNIDNQDPQLDIEAILFLGFNIELDSTTKSYKIDLDDIMIREGRIKRSEFNQIKFVEDDILCTLYDANKEIVYQLITENPLIQNLEYAKDDGSLGRSVIHQIEGYLMLKVPNNKKYDHISFDYINENFVKERIGSVNLNLKK